jgi:uncharacterized protein YxjI
MKSFLIHQKITPLVNRYAVYEAAGPGDEPGALVAFVEQKRFAFKETFNVYSSEDKQTIAFTFKARQVIDFGARYDIMDGNGNPLGVVGKDFKSSLLRSTWHIFRTGQEDKPVLIVQERSQGIAAFRRIWDFLPIISDFPFFIKYHFDFVNPADQKVIATYDKTTTIVDHYRLTINDDAPADVDQRIFIALGIMMDALQGR